MFPSNNLFALVRAYDLVTVPVREKEAFVGQGREFLCDIKPYADAITPLFARTNGKTKTRERKSLIQYRFDAMLSVAYDVGLEIFFDSALPSILQGRHSKRAIRDAFHSVPVCYGVMRPELEEQMRAYRMKVMQRREVEMFLFLGQPIFTIGRCREGGGKRPDGGKGGARGIIYSVSVLHPLFQFLYRNY